MVKQQKVFVVDDDPTLGVSIRRSLIARGFVVELFNSAAKFLSAFGEGCPGCLVLDHGLPEMSGLELQALLIERELLIPIIFISGHAGIPESVQATKAGAIDFLEKPYRLEVLIERVEAALDLDRRQRRVVEDLTVARLTLDALTRREKEIFDLVCAKPESSSSKAIGRELEISPRTVDLHRARILEKLQCRSIVELIGKFGSRSPN